MDSKAQDLFAPLAHRLSQLGENQPVGSLLVAISVVLISYLLYNVRILDSQSLRERASANSRNIAAHD